GALAAFSTGSSMRPPPQPAAKSAARTRTVRTPGTMRGAVRPGKFRFKVAPANPRERGARSGPHAAKSLQNRGEDARRDRVRRPVGDVDHGLARQEVLGA